MRSLMLAAALTGALAVPAFAQSTLDRPTGEFRDYPVDSGPLDNPGQFSAALLIEPVSIEDAAWLRVYFGEATALDTGSIIRVTSLLDNDVQELDAAALAAWSNTTAYLNGDTVIVELIAAPGTAGNRVVIDRVAMEPRVEEVGVQGECGICGATDDRVLSNELWISRLLPAGCTASVYTEDSCMVSAGHCIGGSMVVQFNVPASNPNCSLNHPPAADQYPVVTVDFVNGGVGNDWAVLIPGDNSNGLRPYDVYGDLRPIATSPVPTGTSVILTGYGVDPDNCVSSQVQQTASGTICTVSGSFYTFNVDLRGGNSGSSLIRADTEEIIGIATHCPCCNIATRSDLAVFENARDELCGQNLEFTFPNGLPDLLDPDGSTTIDVVVGADSAAPEAGTGMIHISFGGSPFLPFAMTENAPHEYTASFPALSCGTVVRYYFSALTTDGDTRTSPDTAPEQFYEALVAVSVVTAFEDDFEADEGWTVSGTASDGQWERGTPLSQATCNRGNPGGDADGSGKCYVTDNTNQTCNSDVDDGSTILTSPIMDASGGEPVISYWRWFDNTGNGQGDFPFQDFFLVEVSEDGGASWVNLEIVGPSGSEVSGGWFKKSFRVSDFVTPTSQFRVRFTATDFDPQSIVEAGVDGVELVNAICEEPCVWDCVGNDGVIGIEEFLAVLGTWGEVGAPCDYDGDGVGITDFLKVLGLWGACP